MVERTVREELETVKAYFKEKALRWTSQRELIVEQAFLTHDHFSAEDLLAMIRDRAPNSGVHLATVYRTLQVLEEGQFIEGLDVGRGSRLFEHTLGHDHHDHVICIDCGKIAEFHDDAMELRKAAAARDLGFEMQRHSLRIYGKCSALSSKGRCEHYEARPVEREQGA